MKRTPGHQRRRRGDEMVLGVSVKGGAKVKAGSHVRSNGAIYEISRLEGYLSPVNATMVDGIAYVREIVYDTNGVPAGKSADFKAVPICDMARMEAVDGICDVS